MSFEAGVVIFFRILTPDNTLARSVHTTGRAVEYNTNGSHPDDYVVLDLDDNVLGIYPRDWVAAIMPLETTGPADVINQPVRRDSAPAPAEGDSKGKPGRTKRIDTH